MLAEVDVKWDGKMVPLEMQGDFILVKKTKSGEREVTESARAQSHYSSYWVACTTALRFWLYNFFCASVSKNVLGIV